MVLSYGSLNLDNILFQSYVRDGIEYASPLANGRGLSIAIIAAAGMLAGNGITYVVSRALYARAKMKHKPMMAFFAFWLCVMSVGNFISYVPVRTFTTKGDMALIASGLSIAPWCIALFLGIPVVGVSYHFFVKIIPDIFLFMLPKDIWMQRLLLVTTTYLIFVFFGTSGFDRYGAISYWLSIGSVFFFFPLVTLLCWPRIRKLQNS